ncbi:hypothetical protein Ahy_A05g025160 [Arachis hypogaea]|uniref:Uncharacterized protein n=1 Tax=Arachis hypogaea TaxID=3818 RepID=A0A445D7R8_ARAHY|nr:hypothetical protein Ahy_A05g025160 [Arachis hypogaea]
MEAYNYTYAFHDFDEEPSGSIKQKTKLKITYKKGHCRYCSETRHTKRYCGKRVADEEVATAVAVTDIATDVDGS